MSEDYAQLKDRCSNPVNSCSTAGQTQEQSPSFAVASVKAVELGPFSLGSLEDQASIKAVEWLS